MLDPNVVRRRVRRRVRESYVNCLFAAGATLTLFFLLFGFLGDRFDIEIIVRGLIASSGTIVAAFLLSESLVVLMFGARRATRDEFPQFVAAVEDLCQGRLKKLPRLYVLEMEVPNAMAFGIGFFGQYAIGITKPIYTMLTPRELRGVIAHELGHIRCKDVGLMTAFGLVGNGSVYLLEALSTKFGAILSFITIPISLALKLVTSISQAAISQEREYAADALATTYLSSPAPLIDALTKIASWQQTRTIEAQATAKEQADKLKGRSLREILKDAFRATPKSQQRKQDKPQPATQPPEQPHPVAPEKPGSAPDPNQEHRDSRNRAIFPSLLLTHPLTEYRIEALRALVQEEVKQ